MIHPGRAALEPVQATAFNEGWAAPSPDGKWLAFVSDQTGQPEVYVRALAAEGALTQISLEGGSEPLWSSDGRRLYYHRTTGSRNIQLVEAALRLEPAVQVTSRTDLFDVSDYDAAQPYANYDVAPDGQSFVMIRRRFASYIVVIQNLPELVRRLQIRALP